jgi:hypothetical protein
MVKGSESDINYVMAYSYTELNKPVKIFIVQGLYSHYFILCIRALTGWIATIDIREYIDCSMAQPACLVLVE